MKQKIMTKFKSINTDETEDYDKIKALFDIDMAYKKIIKSKLEKMKQSVEEGNMIKKK